MQRSLTCLCICSNAIQDKIVLLALNLFRACVSGSVGCPTDPTSIAGKMSRCLLMLAGHMSPDKVFTALHLHHTVVTNSCRLASQYLLGVLEPSMAKSMDVSCDMRHFHQSNQGRSQWLQLRERCQQPGRSAEISFLAGRGRRAAGATKRHL